MSDVTPRQPAPVPPRGALADHRGSWIPTGGMIATRFMELRKRRGLMIALIVVTIGIPTIFLVIRLLAHAFAPQVLRAGRRVRHLHALVAGVLYVFGFIVAATLGCTAGSVDLTEGMFRHLVVTGRSRLALYLARIPAGLAIVVPLVAIGFTIVCAVCVFAAPTTAQLRRRQRARRSVAGRPRELGRGPPRRGRLRLPLQDGPSSPNVRLRPWQRSQRHGPGGPIVQAGSGSARPANPPTPAMIRAAAVQIAQQDYSDYSTALPVPVGSADDRVGLWIELEAVIGFIVGLGLGSLLGQRTVAVILMIVLEIVLTPILSRAHIPHLINLQRSVVGLAMAHLEPGGLPWCSAGRRRAGRVARDIPLVPESTTVAVCVIVAWLVGWTASAPGG